MGVSVKSFHCSMCTEFSEGKHLSCLYEYRFDLIGCSSFCPRGVAPGQLHAMKTCIVYGVGNTIYYCYM